MGLVCKACNSEVKRIDYLYYCPQCGYQYIIIRKHITGEWIATIPDAPKKPVVHMIAEPPTREN